MKRLTVVSFAAFLFAAAAVATPQISGITPQTGFTFGETRVEIHGRDFPTETTDCTCLPAGGSLPCPAKVFFGNAEGRVLSVGRGRVVALAPAHPEGVVDVRLQMGGTESTLPHAFRFHPHAQPFGDNHVRYLVPAVRDSLPGAGGSLWITEKMIHNGSNADLVMIGPWTAPGLPVFPPVLQPLESWRPQIYPPHAGDGAFIHVPRPLAKSTAFQLRVRDVSRESEGWGSEVPVVAVEKFAETVLLLDIPTDPRYRVTLRIYGDDNTDRGAGVTVYRSSGGERIHWQIVGLIGSREGQDSWPLWPAYAELDPISDAVRASGERQVRIEVKSYGPVLVDPPFGNPIWALVSLTNNETQQVTTITPHDP